MDATVIEELQIHTPLKTQRKTSAQDEIPKAAALGKKKSFFRFFRKKQWP